MTIEKCNGAAWAASSEKLADMIHHGRPRGELLPVAERMMREEGFSKFERWFRDHHHRLDEREQLPEAVQRIVPMLMECLLDLRPGYQFDPVATEQRLRFVSKAFVPEMYRESATKAGDRHQVNRDVILEFTNTTRGRPYPLLPVDTGGIKFATRYDSREVDRHMNERA